MVPGSPNIFVWVAIWCNFVLTCELHENQMPLSQSSDDTGYCEVESSDPGCQGIVSTSNMADEEVKKDWKTATSIYDFSVKNIDDEDVSLEKYRGHVCIIVNVASKCGLTDRDYTQLQELYAKYHESHGLRVLGFPCNQFLSQEPGDNCKIKEFAKTKFNVEFDLFSKIDVNGDNADPLWKYLKSKQGGTIVDFIKWNFTKFLINKEGQPVKRYGPNTPASDIEKDLEKYW